MAKVTKQGNKVTCWVDQDGVAVPVKYIDPVVQKRDKVVSNAVFKAKKLQAEIKKVKQELSEEIEKYLNETAAEYGENWQGNAQLYDFAADNQVTVKVSKIIGFDERLQVAKTKIDECIKSWSRGASDKIIALVNNAFNVDEKGKLDVKKILGLRQLKIDDPQWSEAMDIISDSVKTVRTKTYLSFAERDKAGEFEQVVLNFSSL